MSDRARFEYAATQFSVFARFDGGAWGPLQATADKTIALGEAAPALLYGQQAFDALTVRRRDADTAIAFRTDDHAARLQRMQRACSAVAGPRVGRQRNEQRAERLSVGPPRGREALVAR